MAVHITIDLSDATFADLVALVDAARVAGVDHATPLLLEDTTLTVEVEPSRSLARTSDAGGEQAGAQEAGSSPLPHLGDAAIRSVVDILTGRQDPPAR